MKNLPEVPFSTFVCIYPDISAFFDRSKKKSTPHRPAMSICVLVSCRIYFSGIYRTVSASAYIPQKIIYVRILSSKFKKKIHPTTFICYQVYTNNLVVNCIVSFICTTRLILFRLCISLKKLCRTIVYIISNICSHNITLTENELFLQKTAKALPV